MARIQIDWVTWRKPTKLGVTAYEFLKQELEEENICSSSFEELRVIFNPESIGKEDFVFQLTYEGKRYAAAVLVGILLAFTEGFGRWLREFDNLLASVIFWVFSIAWMISAFACCGLGLAFCLRLVTYWPSALLYVMLNRNFVRRRRKAIQLSKTYEEYLSLE